MIIYAWDALRSLEIKTLPTIDGMILFVFNSKGLTSEDLKKQICAWIEQEENLVRGSLKLIKGHNGKPIFENSSWQFNLSHSGDLTAVTLHPTSPRGIDIETWKSKKRLSPIVERYFFEDERAFLSQVEEDLDWESLALKMWTIKEARIKVKGGTLFEGLAQINSLSKDLKTHTWEEKGLFSLSLCGTA